VLQPLTNNACLVISLLNGGCLL